MSILLDDRIGSKDLLPYFTPFDVQVELCHLDYADACFVGNAEDGPIYIGIERKVIGDLINSIRSGRLSGHQLAGLMDNFNVCYLIIEGIYRPGHTGELEIAVHGGWRPFYVGKTPILYREVDNFLTSMEEAGLRHRRTGSPQETAFVITDIYKWREKAWLEHKAHRDIYAPVPEHPDFKQGHKLNLLCRPKPTLVTAMAAQIPGIDQKAWKVGEVFNSPLEMCRATEKEWRRVDGIGAKGARKIVEALQQ